MFKFQVCQHSPSLSIQTLIKPSAKSFPKFYSSRKNHSLIIFSFSVFCGFVDWATFIKYYLIVCVFLVSRRNNFKNLKKAKAIFQWKEWDELANEMREWIGEILKITWNTSRINTTLSGFVERFGGSNYSRHFKYWLTFYGAS